VAIRKQLTRSFIREVEWPQCGVRDGSPAGKSRPADGTGRTEHRKFDRVEGQRIFDTDRVGRDTRRKP
jgi:hypothetical protein